MKLSKLELDYRNEMVEKGLKECRSLIGKQKSRNMYFFYEGSLEGFNECRTLDDLENYQTKLEELNKEEIREISYSSLRKDDETIELRESLGIFGDEKTDMDNLWKMKGLRTQINFVYSRLLAYNLLLNVKKINLEPKNSNLQWKRIY